MTFKQWWSNWGDSYDTGALIMACTVWAHRQEDIDQLQTKLEAVYEAGREGISYVGAANYAERGQAAHRRLNDAYYGKTAEGKDDE